jgi:UDP-glucose 4-epimerase
VGIVGGSGYIGSKLADYLSEVYTVKVVDKRPPSARNRAIEYQQADILKYNEIKDALDDVELALHTAIVQIPQINEQKRLGYEVNLLGIQNVCRIVDETPSIKGMLFSGTWHVFGESELKGTIDEAFGFRPDKVEDRARLYALSKTAQEVIVRFYDEMSEKIYGVIRMATVLGEGMPEKTAANIFISKGLRGEPITPYKHSMYRPMLYVDVDDVCKAFRVYATKILQGEIHKEENSFTHVVNLCWPKPITIIDLAQIIREKVISVTKGKVRPEIEIVDLDKPILYSVHDKENIKVNIRKAQQFLGLKELEDPRNSIERIVRVRLNASA